MSDFLGQRQGVPGFYEHMQPPRFDFLALGLWLFGYLSHVSRLFASF
jgi:hypothetical protein